MEYRTEITIDLPRARVVELFDDPDNLGEWQDGFVSMEHVSGEHGEPGMVSKLVYETRGRTMELIETIERRNLPDEFVAVYETGGVWNRHANHFYDEGESTRYVTDTEFRCKGFVRLLMFLRPSMFKKETLKNMERFKEYAESQG